MPDLPGNAAVEPVDDGADMLVTWLVVPVKPFGLAKERLGDALSSGDREALARALCARTLDAVVVSGVQPAFVVTSDPEATAMALSRGLSILPDEGHDHSSAMRAAGRRAEDVGVDALLTLAIDLPLLDAADVRALAGCADVGTFVIAPDRAGTGTNAIAVAPPSFPFSFGPGSRERHVDLARQLGLSIRVLERAGLAVDLDEPADIRYLRTAGATAHSFGRDAWPQTAP